MNEDDRAYYARREFDEWHAEIMRRLHVLNTEGVRVPLGGDAGSVAVSPFGHVLDVRLDRRNIEYLAERALADYLVAAIETAQREAQQAQRRLVHTKWEEH